MGRSANGDGSRRDVVQHLGARLRGARVARGLTMEQVATQAGLTKGFISRLERGEVSPSIASLVAVCDALGLLVGDLLDPPTTSLVRAGSAAPARLGPAGLVEYVLTPGTVRQFALYLSVADPGVASSDQLYTHPADVETVYVLEGTAVVQVRDEEVTLAEGDAFTFPPREPHRWRNGSDTVGCQVLWVFAPAL